MFNGFRFEKEQEEVRACKEKEEQRAKVVKTSGHMRNRLSAGYKQRMHKFLVSMLSDPIKVSTFSTVSPDIQRDVHPEKHLSSPSFHIHGYKTDQERISAAVQRNSVLDLSPNPPKPVLRQREIDREINPRMYFQPRNAMERIRLATDFPNELTQERSKSEQKLHKTTVKKEEKQVKSVKIFPSLHRKTHFKAVCSIMTRLPHSSLLSPEVIGSRESPGQGVTKGNKSFSEEELPYVAREVLKDCEVVKEYRCEFLRAKSREGRGKKEKYRVKSAHESAVYGM